VTRRDCHESLAGGREGLPLRIDPRTNSRFFRSLYIRTDIRIGTRTKFADWPAGDEKDTQKKRMEDEGREVSRFVLHRRFLCLPRLQIIFPPRIGIRNNNGVQAMRTKFKCADMIRIHVRIVFNILIFDTNCTHRSHILFLIKQLQLLSLLATVINIYDD